MSSRWRLNQAEVFSVVYMCVCSYCVIPSAILWYSTKALSRYWYHALGLPSLQNCMKQISVLYAQPSLVYSQCQFYQEKGYTLPITGHGGRDPSRAPLQCLKYHPTLSCHKISNPQILVKRWRAGLSDQMAPSLSPLDAPKHTDVSFVKSFKLPKLPFMYLWNLGRTRTFPQSSVDVNDNEPTPCLVGIWHIGLQH